MENYQEIFKSVLYAAIPLLSESRMTRIFKSELRIIAGYADY